MIPKKLDKLASTEELIVWLNELRDFLQAKEDPENIIKAYKDLLDRQHEGITEEASKGEGATLKELFKSVKETQKKALAGDPEAMGVCGITPESKEECDCVCHTYKTPIKRSPEHFCCENIDPPEHEEDFDRLAQGLRNHVIDDVRFSGLFEYVKDYIRDNFVAKTKIKKHLFDHIQLEGITHGDAEMRGRWINVEDLSESLGLGD